MHAHRPVPGSRRELPRGRPLLASLLLLAGAGAAYAEGYTATAVGGAYTEPPESATTQIASGQDDAVKTVTLPFEFPFHGRLHTQVTVCTNGFVVFGSSTETRSVNATLPSTASPNGIVAALWDDLTTGTGAVKTFTTGAAPNRTFVVAWHHVDTFSGASDSDLSFQVQLSEATGAITLAYARDGVWDGLSYTAGVEDPTGTIATGAPTVLDTNSGQPAQDQLLAPRTVAVSGRILRDRPAATAGGLGGTEETDLPVAGADVLLLREDTGEIAARARTADDGTYTLIARGADPADTFVVEVLASGAGSRVTDASGATYRHRIAADVSAAAQSSLGTVTLDAGTDATSPNFRRALNVQQASERGIDLANAYAAAAAAVAPAVGAETFPQLEFRWVSGAAVTGGRTTYVPANGAVAAQVLVHDGADNPDPYDDDVILRETGHHVLATISVHPGQLAQRSFTAPTSAPAAWADGFATWFAATVRGGPSFIDTKSSSAADVFDLELPSPTPQERPDVTGAVAASLFDLTDGANETIDAFAGTTGGAPSTAADVFAAVDRRMDALSGGQGPFDLAAFFNVWRTEGPDADRRATSRAFIGNGGFADDAAEPDDTAAEGPESRLVGTKSEGRTLSPWNEDRTRFALSGTATALEATVVLSGSTTEADLEILSPSGAVLAATTNTGSGQPTVLRAATLGEAEPGTYAVRVVWKSGPAVGYTVALAEPIALLPSNLAPWTAGEPYKQDFGALGGVAPLTFSVTQAVPGLAKSLSDTRISGTPTAAGDFPVTVRVTDASGGGATFETTYGFTVNRALTVLPFSAATVGTAFGVDVGIGGTDAVWTPGGAAPTGFTTSGGSTLRLTGTPSSARTFTVSGSAVDGIGARLASGTSRFVLCEELPGAVPSDVPPGSHFGYAFDAVLGATARFRFRFRGTGATPTLVAVIDENGRSLDLTDRTSRTGRTVRLDDAQIPATGRWYAIFSTGEGGFDGTVSSAGQAVPPRIVRGVVVVQDAEDVTDVQVAAAAGSRLRFRLRSELTPRRVLPEFIALLDPDGNTIDVPRMEGSRNGREVTGGPVTLDSSGIHVLRIGAASGTPGPIAYHIVVVPPAE